MMTHASTATISATAPDDAAFIQRVKALVGYPKGPRNRLISKFTSGSREDRYDALLVLEDMEAHASARAA